MSYTNNVSIGNERLDFTPWGLIAGVTAVLALSITVFAYASNANSEANEAVLTEQRESLMTQISDSLNVVVTDIDFVQDTVDIQQKDGVTLRCDLPSEFDGELAGCFDFTTVTVSSDAAK